MTSRPVAALEISLRIGQRVRHQDFKGKRVTGIVRGLSLDSEDVLRADIALDEAIVIDPLDENDHEVRIYRQYVPACELAPFDEREELIREMQAALQLFVEQWNACGPNSDFGRYFQRVYAQARTAVAKATGSAA